MNRVWVGVGFVIGMILGAFFIDVPSLPRRAQEIAQVIMFVIAVLVLLMWVLPNLLVTLKRMRGDQ
jgi:uncharacterized membrane protein YhaH (DUF805 family)